MKLKHQELRSIGLEQLYLELKTKYEMDIEHFPQIIKSKFNQEICIRKGDKWINRLQIIVPSYTNAWITFPNTIHSHPVIEYTARWCLIYDLKNKSSFQGFDQFFNALERLAITDNDSLIIITEKLRSWIKLETKSVYTSGRIDTATLISNFILYGIEIEAYGFDESLEYILLQRYYDNRRGNSAQLSFVDPNRGPYTQSDLQRISLEAIESETITSSDKVCILLCRDYGLRPIQLALIREDDIYNESPDPYILIHGAKGIRKSRLRRHPNNVFQRYLSNEVNCAINDLIEHNKVLHKQIDNWYKSFCKRNNVNYIHLPKPLFPIEGSLDRMEDYLAHPTLVEYSPHKNSSSISRQIINLTNKLKIPMSNITGEYIKITAYRFRRTLATTMVIQGYSPEEVAEALDHSSVNSIKHYFMWSRDLISYVNNIYSRSSEMINAVNFWASKQHDHQGANAEHNEIKLTSVASLGICTKKITCEMHPTISCYGCPKFKPYIDGDHKHALENIKSIRDQLKSSSTGAVKTQLDTAYAFAKLIVKEQNDQSMNNK